MKSMTMLIPFALLYLTSELSIAQISLKDKHLTKPELQHGISYKKVDNIGQYYVSEKLDGVRGYWDGKQLRSRQGNQINSPDWFTKSWPAHPIDGELWMARGQFQTLLSCVSKKGNNNNRLSSCWQKVRFMMFDLPKHQGTFSQRVKKMRALVKQVSSPYFDMIKQAQFKDIPALEYKLTSVIAGRGEGLMLHLASAYYKTGRNAALMKLKRFQDAEALVIGHTDGKGKYKGQLGAIKVRTIDGKTFKIGSGFTDQQRLSPPKLGTIITYKYNGLTDKGIPRFARFWRVKTTE
ncbi:DNA ligase [Colwelliaceae bacterium MEBiC 14330]